jgi:RimJ/RimL family protein N-acetyltransferase
MTSLYGYAPTGKVADRTWNGEGTGWFRLDCYLMEMPLPESFATSRLMFERLRAEHTDAIHRMHRDAEQMALLGGVRTPEQTAAYMARNLAHWDEFGFGIWVLRDRASNEIIGRTLLRHLDIDGVDEVETGYGFFPAYWGRGLATEATLACLDYGWHVLKLESIVAITRPVNARSRRVMEKTGMTYEREIVREGLPHVLYRAIPGDLSAAP